MVNTNTSTPEQHDVPESKARGKGQLAPSEAFERCALSIQTCHLDILAREYRCKVLSRGEHPETFSACRNKAQGQGATQVHMAGKVFFSQRFILTPVLFYGSLAQLCSNKKL